MNFYIAQTMRRICAPQHKLSCSLLLWYRLLKALRRSGLKGKRESGAFLLGRNEGSALRIKTFVLYENIDPNCLNTGIVRLDGRFFGTIWKICEKEKLSVVADVHTHPYGTDQSCSDRDHPIISRVGHIALILPNFAMGKIRLNEIGMYTYMGNKIWQDVLINNRSSFFYIGF